MAKPRNLGVQIRALRQQGKTYKEIQKILNCGSTSVCYHLSEKIRDTVRQRRLTAEYKIRQKTYLKHPYLDKLMDFVRRRTKKQQKIHSIISRIYYKKLRYFLQRDNIKMKDSDISVQDLINKYGTQPKCYLTGVDIDILKTNTYCFDHILPSSRGGGSTLDNLGICTKEANAAKSDKTPEEFFELCRLVLKHNKISLD